MGNRSRYTDWYNDETKLVCTNVPEGWEFVKEFGCTTKPENAKEAMIFRWNEFTKGREVKFVNNVGLEWHTIGTNLITKADGTYFVLLRRKE